ncbi:hypothetical protein ACKU5B_009480 [Klebsiella pneumoniae]
MSAAIRRSARGAAQHGAGCTLSARALVQRLCFFSGGTV